MAISVSPPPGPRLDLLRSRHTCGASVQAGMIVENGTAFTTRHESPLSLEMFQIERCTPVPCGPDTCTSPLGPTLMSGSP